MSIALRHTMKSNRIPYIENSDGKLAFLCPDFFIGIGHLYEMNVDFFWNPIEPQSSEWKGIMGFYSPADEGFGRMYLSGQWNSKHFQLAFGESIHILSYADLGSISEKRGNIKAVYDIPSSGTGKADFYVNGNLFATGTSPVGSLTFGAVKKSGVLTGCDYSGSSSTTPFSYSPSVIGSRLFGFTQRIDGQLVHDLVPQKDGTLLDKVTGESIRAAQGTPVYGEIR